MRHPEKVGADDLQELEALVKRYPYFQAARMLYLKVLYLQAGSQFRHELKTSTVHITDHKRLLHYLNLLPGTHLHDVQPSVAREVPTAEMQAEPSHMPEEMPETIKTDNILEDESIVSLNFEDFPTQKPDATPQPVTRHAQDIGPLPLDLDTEETEEESPALETPEIISAGYSLEDEETAAPSDQAARKEKKNQLIDNFIQNNPSIPKTTETTENIEDLSQENPHSQEELFTETLAKIYTKQKLYDKAITTYIKLSLKYPEKSVYFANRIEKIKENINNQE